MGDLRDRWLPLVSLLPLVSTVPTAAADIGRDLVRRYGEPHRRYHDLRHLGEVLDAVDDLAGLADDPDAVRLAAWFHDAVYDVRSAPAANEAASADLAASWLAQVDPARVDEVVRLVLLTATHDPAPTDANGQVLCDADLWVLGSMPARYAQYAADVRAEYGHVPDDAYAAGRSAVMGALLAHDRLYATPTAHDRWEATARANVKAELADLLP